MKRESDQDLVKTDMQLIEEVRKGQRSSFSELVKRHQRGLLRLSMRFMKDMDAAQDVVQEAFIKSYEKLALFEGRASFKSWLYQIAVNTARNKLRENRYDFSNIDDVNLSISATAENSLVHAAVSEIIQKEVDRLPFKQKTALVLRVYEDMSFAEIAEVMECPYDTAKANYRHALMKLKDVFEKQSELRKWTEDVGGFFMELNTKFVEAE
ncbi:RNA polymerase sigma factor [Pseudobdellovibrio exovorus]|uniref:RNA polymerase sigma factor n=1 Tax=Pseudobdellovibrio exovorus JSS TaxID=1184267 RepID=M4V8X8_9BACT|nr:sigma-70 family RNA polymerase sigma factor [Pseudobdellovibrio exovorus]AGH94905.1 RNA polymerase sigma-E factor [Pseudobdellovibrio exovorus JSS]